MPGSGHLVDTPMAALPFDPEVDRCIVCHVALTPERRCERSPLYCALCDVSMFNPFPVETPERQA